MIGIRYFKDNDPSRNFEGSSIGWLSELQLKAEDSAMLSHEVIRTGKFAHRWFGLLDITVEMLSNMVENFSNRVAGVEPVFNIDHLHHKGALGWHKKLSMSEKPIEIPVPNAEPRKETVVVLHSQTELTPFGQTEIVQQKKYRYTSAEIRFDFKRQEVLDPEDEEAADIKKGKKPDEKDMSFGSVLMGSAATNIPFIPNLASFSIVSSRVEDLYLRMLEEYKNPAVCYDKVVEELSRRRG